MICLENSEEEIAILFENSSILNQQSILNSHFSKFAIYMLFEETDTEESHDSQSDVSSLDDGFSKMQFESSSSEEQVTDDDDDDAAYSLVWSEIESESDAEFLEDYGMVEEVQANSEDSTINPIDCYRYFITDEIISPMVRETNRYAEQHAKTQKLSKRSKTLQWKPTTNEEILKFFGNHY